MQFNLIFMVTLATGGCMSVSIASAQQQAVAPKALGIGQGNVVTEAPDEPVILVPEFVEPVTPPPTVPVNISETNAQEAGAEVASPLGLQSGLDSLPSPQLLGLEGAVLSGLGATRGAYSAVPSMIGDTTAGGCGVVRFNGGVPIISVAHPTFACSRLNIAENNSASARDRFYTSYRHFHNASSISVFATSGNGGESTPNIDRLTFGLEKRIGERSSIEFRVPVNYQLSSDLSFSQLTSPVSGAPPIVSLPLNDIETSLGNIAIVLKSELIQGDRSVFSGGLAINLPTAPDVQLSGLIDDDQFVIEDPVDPSNNRIADINFVFDSTIRNELVSLSPFVAFAAEFGTAWFTQGFAQVDIPVTPLVGSLDAQLITPGSLPRLTVAGDIPVQKIGRLSLGIGRYLYRSGAGLGRTSISFVSELHFTTTLEDAELTDVEVLPAVGSTIPATTVQIGNIANRTDVLDIVFGIPISYNSWRITHGAVAPLKTGANRGFDFEYNLMVGREF